ncbi:MAG: hypothetical protein V1921_01330 [Candidatus Altiarchaeota archaeon]
MDDGGSDRYSGRKRYTSETKIVRPAKNTSERPAAQSSSKESTFLSKLARSAGNEGGGGYVKTGWMSTSVDKNSPAYNLQSRLKWVETAYKQENAPASGVTPVSGVQSPAIDPGITVEIATMRQRLQNMICEMQSFEKDLSSLEVRLQPPK